MMESNDEKKPWRTRRHAPKTRTGCATCKIRRVKCGEERPVCRRCTVSGYTCDGYEHLTRQHQKKAKKPRPLLPNANKCQQIVQNPSHPLFRHEHEYWYFVNFSSKTSFEIFPTFNSSSLRQMLLQAAQEEPSIRHAVVALGAMDVTTEHMPDLRSLSDPKKEDHSRHQLSALQQYTIAIKHMQNGASSGRRDFRTTLLECLVALCFEAWSGNHTLAVMQIQTGLKLIHHRRRETLQAQTPGSQSLGTNILEDDLVRAFTGLDMYTICEPRELKGIGTPGPIILEQDDERRGPGQIVFEQEERAVLSQMPEVFSSLRDAQICRNALKLQVMRFLSSYSPLPTPPRNEFVINGWWGEVPSSTMAYQQSLSTDILRWKAAFQPLWKKLKADGHSTRLLAVILNLQVKTMSFALLVPCIKDEATFDDYNKDFLEIIDLAEDVLKNSKSTRHSFLLDTHVVIPLFVTAHKCRDRAIRRNAISLMYQYPRREGVWDSLLCGTLAEWVMELEERHLHEGQVPGWARICGLTARRDGNQEITMTCIQRTSEASEEVVIRRRLIRESGI